LFLSQENTFDCTALTTWTTTETNCIISHAEDTTALLPIVFINGTHRWMVGFPQRKKSTKVNFKLLIW